MIEGKRVILRPMREEDLDDYIALTGDAKENGEYFPLRISSKPILKKKFIETGMWSDDGGRFMITDKTDRLVGFISYFKGSFYMSGFELGYQIFKGKDRGKGYVSESVKLMSAYLFQEYQIGRLQISVPVGNEGSKKVAEKCGYQFEGIRRNVIFHRGEYIDSSLFSMIREECPKLSELII